MRDAGNGRGGLLQSDLFMMNGRAGTAIDPMDIAPGQRIRIRLINAGNLVHAMHLHGQSFKVIAVDGNAVPPAVQLVQDTVTIAPGERFDLEVNGTNPGVWLFHCHINNHAANGMSTVLQYDGYQPFDADAIHAAHGSSAPLPTGASNSEGSQARSPNRYNGSCDPNAGGSVQRSTAVRDGHGRGGRSSGCKHEPGCRRIPDRDGGQSLCSGQDQRDRRDNGHVDEQRHQPAHDHQPGRFVGLGHDATRTNVQLHVR